jgi:progressive ankylosis protein
MKIERDMSFKRIFVFWYPLAATWLMMAIENPFLAGIIARLDMPKHNLAAFGAAYSLALIFEAPIIMIMSASTALANGRDAFIKLRRFTNMLNMGVTLFLLVIIIPPLFYHVAEQWMNLPGNVARLTHNSLMILIPWPASIGVRRYYQGILIRENLTRRVAYGTVMRLVTMAVTALVLYYMKVEGAYVGAGALSVGVVTEALSVRLMAYSATKRILGETQPQDPDQKPLTYRFIAKFYYPLAIMSTLSLGVHPLVIFFIGTSRFPLESLAVLPVINGLLFLFRSIGLSFTEVVVALLGKNNEGYLPLRNFAIMLGTILVGGLTVIAFTPLAEVWFHTISGLSMELTAFSSMPIRLLILVPGLVVLTSVQRGVLVTHKKTPPITIATIIEVAIIISVLFVTINYFEFTGALAAASAYFIGRLCANTYLFPHLRRTVSR